jgi:hypothetical protein
MRESIYAPSLVVDAPDLEMVQSMSAFLKLQLSKAHLIRRYEGATVAVHAAGRGKQNFMPRIGNTTHVAESNNGYARKASGGFYNH